MKLKILILFCVLLFCSCETSQKAQSNEISNEANFNQPTNVNAIENRQVEIEKPNLVDDSRFSPVKIKRTDQRSKFSLNIDVEYPQLKKAKTPQETKFNQYVKRKVDEQIADFNNFLVKEKLKEAKVKHKLEFEINLDYKVEYASENFTSVLMNWNGYSGYLNMDYFPSTINFDLKNGKVIEQKDIFEPDVKYLDDLSKLSRQILGRTCLYCGCGKNISAGDLLPNELVEESETVNSNTSANKNPLGADWYKKGTEPKEENFNNWSLTAEGFKITFGEYQVGPGCIGIIDIVIPFANLQPILRKDLNFN